MSKLNLYQKSTVILYGIAFIYFGVIHVPFKVADSDEIVYDTLFSQRANLDISRLLLIIIVISIISAVMLFSLSNLRLNVKLKSQQHLKFKQTLIIILSTAVLSLVTFLATKKYKSSQPTNEVNLNTIETPTSIDTSAVAYNLKQEPSNYSITNEKHFSNDKFEEFVSFTFHNTSSETISNIMFKEAYFPVKHKKNNFTNRKITLNPNDSTQFLFKKDHDELFVYKLRFASGKTITHDVGHMNYEHMVYMKFGKSEN